MCDCDCGIACEGVGGGCAHVTVRLCVKVELWGPGEGVRVHVTPQTGSWGPARTSDRTQRAWLAGCPLRVWLRSLQPLCKGLTPGRRWVTKVPSRGRRDLWPIRGEV